MFYFAIPKSRVKIIFGLGFAFVLGAFFLLLTYPGVLSPDSITSWTEASRGRFTTIKPPFLAMLQSIYLIPFPIMGAVAAFSLTQAVLFWFSIFFVLSLVIEKLIPFIIACFLSLLLIPLWSYATVHWTDVWVLIFLLLAISSFELLRRSKNSSRTYLAAGIFFAFLAVSTRHNAVSVLPIIILPMALWLRRNRGVGRFGSIGLAALTIALLFVGTKLFLLLPQVQITPSLAPFGLINQYFGTIAHSSSEKRRQLLTNETPLFDERFGPGSLDAALKAYDPRFNGKLVWGTDSILKFNNLRGFETVLHNGDFITASFVRIVKASPEGFARHKLTYVKGQFGSGSVRTPLNAGVHTNILGLESKPVLPKLKKSLSSYARLKSSHFVFQHWFSFAVGFVALVINVFVTRVPVAGWLVMGAMLYAIPYILFETGWEWRYLMPSYVMNFLAVAALAEALRRRLLSQRAESVTTHP